MSDLSDPAALPDDFAGLRAKLAAAMPEGWLRSPESIGAQTGTATGQFAEAAAGALPALLTELDGLRAQIEEALSLHAKSATKSEDPRGGNWPDVHVCVECLSAYPCATVTLLAQSPRGTVARIQSDALEAAADSYYLPNGRNGHVETTHALVAHALRARAAVIREAAGQ